jgi:hypothetical protein
MYVIAQIKPLKFYSSANGIVRQKRWQKMLSCKRWHLPPFFSNVLGTGELTKTSKITRTKWDSLARLEWSSPTDPFYSRLKSLVFFWITLTGSLARNAPLAERDSQGGWSCGHVRGFLLVGCECREAICSRGFSPPRRRPS